VLFPHFRSADISDIQNLKNNIKQEEKMRSKLFVTSYVCALIMAGVVLTSNRLSLAEYPAAKPADAGTAAAPAEAGSKVEVNNKYCPIDGGKIEEGKAFKVEHNGKIYNLCCSMCEKDFKKDPEAAIKKLEMLEAQEGEGTEETADGHDMPGMGEGDTEEDTNPTDKKMEMPTPGMGN
jgi:YHS domain-containing protein